MKIPPGVALPVVKPNKVCDETYNGQNLVERKIKSMMKNCFVNHPIISGYRQDLVKYQDIAALILFRMSS
jgi:hypothetical protein